ncbi:cytochrome P450 [Biscogniauxia mediterranea]|nr:cytochrome P450 [Biscogniauxia mediterranea]
MISNISITEWWPLSAVATCVVTLITAYAIIYQLSCRQLDPREPPVIASPIPYVGHLLGMAVQGGRYVKNLGIRNRQLPIFALPVPNSRLYIVTDPSLAAAVQRASRALSFTPVVPAATERVLGLDAATMRIVRRHLDPGPGDERGFLADIQDMVYAWLGPGPYLGELTLAAARELQREIASYSSSSSYSSAAQPQPPPPTDLLAWIRHLVTPATARYLYGPENPLALDPSLESAFWDFDHGLGGLLLMGGGVLAALTARRAYAGRERLAAALAAYLEAGQHEVAGAGASRIVRERVAVARRHGWTLRAAARSELSFLFAGVVNVTTAAFWLVARVFADAALLAAVRAEVEAVLGPEEEEEEEDGTEERRRLSVADLRERCPWLVAAYRECLRLGSDNYSTRVVVGGGGGEEEEEGTLLAGRYFLRRGAVVQVAGGVIHADPAIWGDDADEFDPGRFLDKDDEQHDGDGDGERRGRGRGREGTATRQKKTTQVHPAAFRAFGGGKTLCPGRHLAMNEILCFVALVVLQFDIEAADDSDHSVGDGKKKERFHVPRKNDGVLPIHILEPVSPVMVRIARRKDEVVEGGVANVRFEM